MTGVYEINNLSKSIISNGQKYEILRDINFTVQKGDFISIMGASGSGKSTLLYLLGLLDQPTNGIIKINDKDVSKLNDKEKSKIRRKHLGFVFQSYNLIPTLSVRDNILLPIYLDYQDTKKYCKKVDIILERVGLSNLENRTPMELSGGEQQRVAIGRSLINNPELILLDEPIGNLDSRNGNLIMELLRDLNKKNNTTIVQVTHSKEASQYGNRYFYMTDGRLSKDIS